MLETEEKGIDYYLELPYPITITKYGIDKKARGFSARLVGFGGQIESSGSSIGTTMQNLRKLQRTKFKELIEKGDKIEIPEL